MWIDVEREIAISTLIDLKEGKSNYLWLAYKLFIPPALETSRNSILEDPLVGHQLDGYKLEVRRYFPPILSRRKVAHRFWAVSVYKKVKGCNIVKPMS